MLAGHCTGPARRRVPGNPRFSAVDLHGVENRAAPGQIVESIRVRQRDESEALARILFVQRMQVAVLAGVDEVGDAGMRQVEHAKVAVSENGGGLWGVEEAVCVVSILSR